jgi:lysophospholipase L1-like esterase
VLANAGLFLASSALSLVLCEVAVRTISPQPLPEDPRRIHPQFFYANHPRLGFTMNPEFRGRFRHSEFDTQVRISSLGIRDREFGAKPAGVRRVLILGDSYTFGWGVEETQRFGNRLEELLQVASPGRWQVVSAGINAYATRDELAWLDEYGWKLEPDLVVLEFCMGNDFDGNVGPGFHVENGFLVGNHSTRPQAVAPTSMVERVKIWVRDHSELFVFLRELRNDWRAGLTPREKRRRQLVHANDLVDEGFAPTARIVGALNDDATRHHVPWVLMVVPMRHQVYGTRDVDRAVIDYPNGRLRALGAGLGVPTLDLLPAFRERVARKPARLYFDRDPHWTREGHQAAAEILLGFLRERALLGS